MGRKQFVYEEYFVHDNYMKKLYSMYLHKTKYDKFIDILVLFAIIFTLMGLILEFLINIDNHILHLIHSLSTIILVIFAIELLREYAKSKTTKEFFKRHWIDFVLVVFLSFYFLFVNYFGIAKVASELSKVKGAAQEAKHFRGVFNFFKELK